VKTPNPVGSLGSAGGRCPGPPCQKAARHLNQIVSKALRDLPAAPFRAIDAAFIEADS